MSADNQHYLVVGEVLKPWGYRGEVKIKILTDYPNRLIKHKTLYLGPQARAYQVERARLHSGYALLKFVGLDTDTSVAKLRGELIQIPMEEAAKLKRGQYYHHEIIGLNVVTPADESLGVVAEILETGANDVYLVRTPQGKEILLPAIQSVVKKIDLDAKTMTVELLPGLVDL
ncbi:MAG: ribosome maturation factor RimM [Chloroflexi bacterium]|nr:ribosome maturation factor RimM [Chloroflexota bacterium]